MVAGRAAERIGQPFAGQHQHGAMHGGGGTGPGRGPGLRGDGAGSVAQVVAALAHDAVGVGDRRQGWRGPAQRHWRRGFPLHPECAASVPTAVRQELDVAAVMHERPACRRRSRAAPRSGRPACARPSSSMSIRSGRSGMGCGLPETMNSRGAWERCVSSRDGDHRFAVPLDSAAKSLAVHASTSTQGESAHVRNRFPAQAYSLDRRASESGLGEGQLCP